MALRCAASAWAALMPARQQRNWQHSAVRGLVSLGVAGAIDPALRAGTLVVPEMVMTGSGESWPVDAAWRTNLLAALLDDVKTAGGALLASAEMLSTVSAKRTAWQESNAGAADMESGEIAKAAHKAGLRYLVVRAVADEAATPLPPAAAAMDKTGRLALGALLSSLARRPGQLPDLIGLGLKSRRACGALKTACRRAGPRLALSP